MRYRPEVDGLRAIAVVPVILFHAGYSLFSGGFVGVDVFFVISGFLITTIICSEIERGSFSLLNFYEKRMRRILPALFSVILTSILLAWFFLMPSDMYDFLESIIATIFCSSNILFWKESNYWDTVSELKPLLHTWSLAVEEQFYIIFPIFLLIFWKRKRLLGILLLGGVAVLSLMISQWGAYNEPTANFYLLPTRAWELAIGAGLSFLVGNEQASKRLRSNEAVNSAGSMLGMLMVLYANFCFDEKTPFPSVYALVPTLGSGLIIYYASPKNIVGRILAWPILVWIGLVSYSAYLWHQPIFAFARYISFPELNHWLHGGLVLSLIPISYLSWRFIERPFRNKEAFTRKKIWILSGTCSIALVSIALWGVHNEGFKNRGLYTDLVVKRFQPDNKILTEESWANLRNIAGDENYGVTANDYDNELWFDINDESEKLLIIGNSHSKDVFNVLKSSKSASDRFQIARYGVQIGELANHEAKMFHSPNFKHADLVMVATKYSEKDIKNLKGIVEYLISKGKKVVLVKSIDEFEVYGNYTLADKLFHAQVDGFKSGTQDEFETRDAIDNLHFVAWENAERSAFLKKSDKVVTLIHEMNPEVIVLDRMDYAVDRATSKYFSMSSEFDKYYYDYGHHTLAGAKFFGKRVDEIDWCKKLLK